jgi:hypothetical protein
MQLPIVMVLLTAPGRAIGGVLGATSPSRVYRCLWCTAEGDSFRRRCGTTSRPRLAVRKFHGDVLDLVQNSG